MAMEIVPERVPVAVGVNFTWKVVVPPPEATVVAGWLSTLKSPVVVTALAPRFNVELPLLVIVKVRVTVVEPMIADPKSV